MPIIRYEISPVPAGWQVACNGTLGPPYSDREAAVRDTLVTADRLIKDGYSVDVRLFDIDGVGTVLRPEDIRRFTARL